MKKDSMLGALWTGCVYAYLLGVGISGVYFNWQYAQENGFLKWLFFGELIPTVQGTIWPYYAIKHFSSPDSSQRVTDSARKELAEFRDSIVMRNQAFHLISRPDDATGPTYTVPKEDHDLALGLLRKSLDKSHNVSDASLSLLDAELPNHYRNEFQRGLELYLEGVAQDDREKASVGSN